MPSNSVQADSAATLAKVLEDQERFNACITFVNSKAAGKVEGVFGPQSMSWMIYREPMGLLGGVRSVLLQFGHPGVAAGVNANSRFRADMLGRARRTFTTMFEMIYGTLDEALEAAGRVHALHMKVGGNIGEGEPGGWAGRPYRAPDPELLHWVFATCLDSLVAVYSRLVRPLSPDETDRFYQESIVLGALFGVPPDIWPPNFTAFLAWFDEMLTGDRLAFGPVAKDLAGLVLNSTITRGPFDELLAAGMLPDSIREFYGLRWGPADQRAFAMMMKAAQVFSARVPDKVRYTMAWHQANYRLSIARGERPGGYARLLNRIDAMVDLPMSIRPVAVAAR